MILEETTQTIIKDNKDNKNIYYDNDDNITQQRCDQINLLGRRRNKVINNMSQPLEGC